MRKRSVLLRNSGQSLHLQKERYQKVIVLTRNQEHPGWPGRRLPHPHPQMAVGEGKLQHFPPLRCHSDSSSCVGERTGLLHRGLHLHPNVFLVSEATSSKALFSLMCMRPLSWKKKSLSSSKNVAVCYYGRTDVKMLRIDI